MFQISKKSKKSQARVGILKTAHGSINTPFFMPIATKAAVKSLTAEDVKNLGAEIILSNTYHNLLRPGTALIKKFGGLHDFMQTDLPILTDSGGYQVFSLAKLRKIKGDNVSFQSHIDGQTHVLNPKKVIDIQVALNSDIMMVLDECVGIPVTKKNALKAVETTTRWAKMAIDYKRVLEKKNKNVKKQLMFGIVQGADFKDLRVRSAKELTELPFDGFAIGGLAVGEGKKAMYKVLKYTAPLLPQDKPRYMMGVGHPEDIVQAVQEGIDMFDCVIPSREARHGKLYVWSGQPNPAKKNFYSTINITNAKYRNDKRPINNFSLKKYSKAYLHHLFRTQEPLALRLATLNNLEFYLGLMNNIGRGIKNNQL